MNTNYYSKYIKYKGKYLELKKGGAPKAIPESDENMLNFIKDLIFANVGINFIESPSKIYDYTIYNANIVFIKDTITKAKNKDELTPIKKIVFSKGIDRLFNFADFVRGLSKISDNNKLKQLLIAQYIVVNQVFSDGNHRTAIYFLKNYSNFTNKEIDFIMDFTERIHKYGGDLQRSGLWRGADGKLEPNIDLIMANGGIRRLFM